MGFSKMAHNENYIGNYSPSSFRFFHQDSPLNVDLRSQLNLPSVHEAHEWLQVFPISTDCGVNLQTPILEFDPDDIILQYDPTQDDQSQLRQENFMFNFKITS
ncbi:unnamed protein product [Orchesella dallaii]|uniref:Uncharacterized protein n=1 Tax=Orchesella dallaii TaxID=48710 RepID=A0ABP1PRB2_9HEXA